VVVSDAAVVFEAIGFGLTFLSEKIQALRYCALSYKDRSKWSAPIAYAEELNPYTYFNSLRKCIAYTHPYRGSLANIYSDVKNTVHFSKQTEAEKTGVAVDEKGVANKSNNNNANNNTHTTERKHSTSTVAAHGHRGGLSRSNSSLHKSGTATHKSHGTHTANSTSSNAQNTANNTNINSKIDTNKGKLKKTGTMPLKMLMRDHMTAEEEQAANEARGEW
jgi:hypothetical protein